MIRDDWDVDYAAVGSRLRSVEALAGARMCMWSKLFRCSRRAR